MAGFTFVCRENSFEAETLIVKVGEIQAVLLGQGEERKSVQSSCISERLLDVAVCRFTVNSIDLHEVARYIFALLKFVNSKANMVDHVAQMAK